MRSYDVGHNIFSLKHSYEQLLLSFDNSDHDTQTVAQVQQAQYSLFQDVDQSRRKSTGKTIVELDYSQVPVQHMIHRRI